MSSEPQLNQSKIARRPKETALALPALVANAHTPLISDAKIAVETRKQTLLEHSNHFLGSLLNLYNQECIEFVEQGKNGGYEPVDWPHQATHRLRATSWLTERTLGSPDMLYASSVVAEPLKPRLKRTELKIHKAWPKKAPAYKDEGGLEGKHNVLRFFCVAMKADFPLRLISKMNVSECDLLYRNLCRANLIFNS